MQCTVHRNKNIKMRYGLHYFLSVSPFIIEQSLGIKLIISRFHKHFIDLKSCINKSVNMTEFSLEKHTAVLCSQLSVCVAR